MDLEPSKLEGRPLPSARPTRSPPRPTPSRGRRWRASPAGGWPIMSSSPWARSRPIDVALRLMAPGGTPYAVGMPHTGETSAYEPVILAALGQGVRGTLMGDVVLARDIPWDGRSARAGPPQARRADLAPLALRADQRPPSPTPTADRRGAICPHLYRSSRLTRRAPFIFPEIRRGEGGEARPRGAEPPSNTAAAKRSQRP